LHTVHKCYSTFSVKWNLCSNFDCSWNPRRLGGTPEAQRAEIRGRTPTVGKGSWEGGSEPPPYQLWGLGSAVSSPSGVRGGAPITNTFWTY